MAYADRNVGGSRAVAIVIVAILVASLGYAFVTGLAYDYVKKQLKELKTFEVDEPPPPAGGSPSTAAAARPGSPTAAGVQPAAGSERADNADVQYSPGAAACSCRAGCTAGPAGSAATATTRASRRCQGARRPQSGRLGDRRRLSVGGIALRRRGYDALQAGCRRGRSGDQLHRYGFERFCVARLDGMQPASAPCPLHARTGRCRQQDWRQLLEQDHLEDSKGLISATDARLHRGAGPII